MMPRSLAGPLGVPAAAREGSHMAIEHHELNTSDLKGAKKFYKGVFGWKFQDMKMDGGQVYSLVSTKDGKAFGGFQAHPMPGAPSAWLNYVTVDSLKKAVAKVEKNGGTILMPPTEIPNMGSFSMCQDPQGAAFAMWQAAPPPKKAAKKKAEKKASKKKAGKKKK